MITEKPSWIRHEGMQIFSIDIQPDGLRFATGGGDQKVRIWNMKSVSKDTENDDSSQRLLATIRDHFGSVNCVRWAKHGRYLASGSDDQVILIHERKAGSGTSEFGSGEPPDVENWKVILILRGHTADVVIISHTAGMGGCSAPFPVSPAPPHGLPAVARLPPPPHRIVRVDRHRGGEGAPAVAASATIVSSLDGGCSLEKSINDHSVADGIQEGTGSNNEQECQSEAQVTGCGEIVIGKSAACCDSCGNRLPLKISKKKKQDGEQLLCRHCEKLWQSKQYCSICKKIWHHTDGGNWVCCDECQIWVHVECDRTCNNMEDLEITDYFCPDCKSKHKRVSTVEQMNTSKSSECASTSKEKLPEMVPVCCFGMEALYLPEKHMILCQCKSCKERIMSLSEWERHTGSRKKNWKMSVKLKSTGEPLITLLDDIPGGNFKSSTASIKKEELLKLLANSYSPVYAKWTTERCAVCRWVEDWDYNKIPAAKVV